MDGRGRALDNVFVERLWRSVKYEEVYLKDYRDGWEAEASLARYFRFYCQRRIHQALDYRTPLEVYQEGRPRPIKVLGGEKFRASAGLRGSWVSSVTRQQLPRPRETLEGVSRAASQSRLSLIQDQKLSSFWGPPHCLRP